MLDTFFKDGAALLALGGVGAYLRDVPGRVTSFIVSQTSASMTLHTGDPLFDKYYAWLAEQDFLLKPKKFRLHEKNEVKVLPIFEFNAFRYKQYWVVCSISLSRNRIDDSYINEESISFRIFGGGTCIFEEITNQLKEEDYKGVLISNRWGRGGYDRCSNIYRPGRSLNTIFLPESFKEGIVSDIQNFLDSKGWYKKHSIMWKRGYLLYGEPGGGKSSLIFSIASHFKMDIIKLNFTDVDNETFADIYSDLDENSLFVLEDFDCSNSSNRTDLGTPSSGSKNLTFDCILNHLDGPNSKEGVITFITTNIIKDLDPALIRPGRIDKIYEIPRATRIQKKEMFLSFYPDSNLSDSFASLVEDMSMSSLQEIFIVNKGNTDKDVIDSLINKKSESEALRGTVV